MRSFSQLVRHPGNDNLVKAAQLSVISIVNGQSLHLHAEGVRGTGKTSVLRSYRAIVPEITRVRGCQYNCDPGKPHCPHHSNLDQEQLLHIGTEQIPMPFVEISPSAKLGTVVGSIDLEKLTDSRDSRAAIMPGTIPRAHRGIIFVDEINRLADTAPELADVLLDVMGTRPGRIQIEESGLPKVELPVSVSVWAASNPDEDPGPLEEVRRQLSDRFDMVVPVRRPTRRDQVEQILSSDVITDASHDQEATIKSDLTQSNGQLSRISISNDMRSLVAGVYVEFQLESLRAAEALLGGARLNALLAERSAVTIEDLTTVAPLVLEHRVDPGLIPRIIKYMEAQHQGDQGSKREQKPADKAETASAPVPGSAAHAKPNPASTTSHSQGSSERAMNWLQKAMQKLGGNSGQTGGSRVGRNPQRSSRGTCMSQDPTKTPILAPPLTARPLSELEHSLMVTEPVEGDRM